ncbi:conserved Plasmodium protein, unknown function [Plasmodium berghei]|uniref:CCZ1/INTU/HSP4 first Longin domain-containing protein n=2 Tax=Plasmodium berghei TaxID=5821 RepID=A0A509AKA6_PLABA|nr:conserved protein, unknown function [Plasmodium berghei ANKA]CXI46238.1 conserved Plasmodium protein, unknown function [Plasmodium berghei]SCM22763.1 conserved Plasmodium protein, unknown function [Plasmodium berghei]SCN25668.1 conserved Plasmodium protein, unknown function [Plasmodium berghei]SCO60595.1 conserved Plasmodium protein, unknown function [Plasmodium berghei]SCO62332.1 conserved Plasmodium protein, unknown function [Plasmodium berghei]|eukprot:XP_034421749.1 conserved protein, unknown function [Plasmodium berghei ANKA]
MDKTKIEALFIYDEDIEKIDKTVTDEELQAEKVLYYYPNETHDMSKVAHASAMEGISVFIKQFSKSHLDHIVTTTNLMVIEKWYKRVFITIVAKNTCKNNNMENLVCKLLHHILKNFISIFTLLHGHIRSFLKYKKYRTSENINKKKILQNILDDYVFTYINAINNETLSIYNELQSFYMFPVENHIYITVQNLISSLVLTHKRIKHGALFYEGYFIYSSLPLEEIKVIYNYLVSYNGIVNNLKLNQPPFKKIASSAATNTNGGLSSFGRCNSVEDKNGFLLGIKKSSVFMPVITLAKKKKYKLVAFIFKGILIILLIKGSTIKDEDFDIIIDIQNKWKNENKSNIFNLNRLNDHLQLQFKKYINRDDAIKYFYYNKINNSVRASNNNKKFTPEELLLVSHIHHLFDTFETKQNKFKSNKIKKSKSEEIEKETDTENKNKETELFIAQNSSQNSDDKNYNGLGENAKTIEADQNSEAGTKPKDSAKDKDGLIEQDKNNKSEKSESNWEKATNFLENKIKNPNILTTKAETETEKNPQPVTNNFISIIEKEETPNNLKTNETITENSQNNNSIQNKKCEKKKIKLVFNPELNKKIFYDVNYDLKIKKYFFKEANSPWIFGKREMKREIFMFLDDNKMSLTKAQNCADQIMNNNFSNIYI